MPITREIINPMLPIMMKIIPGLKEIGFKSFDASNIFLKNPPINAYTIKSKENSKVIIPFIRNNV